MLLREATRNKNNQELVKASIDALIEALEEAGTHVLVKICQQCCRPIGLLHSGQLDYESRQSN